MLLRTRGKGDARFPPERPALSSRSPEQLGKGESGPAASAPLPAARAKASPGEAEALLQPRSGPVRLMSAAPTAPPPARGGAPRPPTPHTRGNPRRLARLPLPETALPQGRAPIGLFPSRLPASSVFRGRRLATRSCLSERASPPVPGLRSRVAGAAAGRRGGWCGCGWSSDAGCGAAYGSGSPARSGVRPGGPGQRARPVRSGRGEGGCSSPCVSC